MSTKAVKWSSVLFIISGLFLAVPILFHPDMSTPGYALLGSWVPVHILLGISTLTGLAALILFYGIMSPKISVVGHVALWFSIIGTALFMGLLFFVESAIMPVLAGNPVYAPLLSETGPIMDGALGMWALTAAVIISIGFILFGGYLITARIISWVNGILFIIGTPLIAFSPPLPYAVMIIGGLLFGIALIWLGVSIIRGRAHETLESTLRIYDECMIQAGGHA
jgi:hypothetical protein